MARPVGNLAAMRKPDPERMYLARRAAHFRRLVLEHRLDELEAEHWIAAWEREAESRGLDRHGATFWDDGRVWIEEGRRKK
jgi:hypothetical protein